MDGLLVSSQYNHLVAFILINLGCSNYIDNVVKKMYMNQLGLLRKKKQREMAVPIYNLTEMQVIIVFYDR